MQDANRKVGRIGGGVVSRYLDKYEKFASHVTLAG
jgi:hypothetical protein